MHVASSAGRWLVTATWAAACLGTAGCRSADDPAADCTIGMFVLSPLAKGHGYKNSVAYDHSSTLKSLQEIFGVSPLMRAAAGRQVADLADLFVAFP